MERRRREVKRLPHHEQDSLCTTRPPYRQGRQLTAVKVYTVNDESQHLIISGVPALGLQDDLRKLCGRYGDVKSLTFIPNYSNEPFVEGYHIQYARIQSARFAKRLIDGRAFFGGSLHVCYAPEMESISETRNKLMQRRRDVARRCSQDECAQSPSTTHMRMSGQGTDLNQGRSIVRNFSSGPCIWNGKETIHDPRLLLPAEQLEKVSSLNYGPPTCGPDWRDVGVREVLVTPLHTKKDLPNLKRQSNKPPIRHSLSISTRAVPVVNPMPQSDNSPGAASSNKAVTPVLRFVPSQVKGLHKKIVFHPKQNMEPQVASGNPSLDNTVQTVRDRIRAVSVPNVKILLDRIE